MEGKSGNEFQVQGLAIDNSQGRYGEVLHLAVYSHGCHAACIFRCIGAKLCLPEDSYLISYLTWKPSNRSEGL